MNTELEQIEKMVPAKLFKPVAMDRLLLAIEAEVTAEVPDVETDAGRKAITSLAYKVARSKTTIDDIGKEFVAKQKAAIAEIDGVRKTSRDFLDCLKVKVRMPLTDWENAEQDRVTKIQGKINRLRDLGDTTDDNNDLLSSQILKAKLAEARKAVITKVYMEYQDEAINAKNQSIVELTDAIPKAEELERNAEAARVLAEKQAEDLRIENEQRIAREAVENADIDARRELEERDRKAAQEKAEQEARERNTKHKGAINRAAVKAIQEVLPFVTDDDAKKLVKAIVAGNIPNVTINY